MEPEPINMIVEIIKNSALSETVALAAVDAWRYSVLLDVIDSIARGLIIGFGGGFAAYGFVRAVHWLAKHADNN